MSLTLGISNLKRNNKNPTRMYSLLRRIYLYSTDADKGTM